jgi:hypothetical protein
MAENYGFMKPPDLGEPIEPHKLEPGTVYYFFDGMHYYQKKVYSNEGGMLVVTDRDGQSSPAVMNPTGIFKIKNIARKNLYTSANLHNARTASAAAAKKGGRRTKHRKPKRRRSSRRN